MLTILFEDFVFVNLLSVLLIFAFENSDALHLLGIFWKNFYLLCGPMILVIRLLVTEKTYVFNVCKLARFAITI